MHVTVLTGFIDPKGREYKMVRNDAGDLLSVTTPSGKWLHFEYDGAHRIRSIADSRGRTVQYVYDSGGRLIRVIPSEGDADAYTYNDRNQMVTAAHGSGQPFLINRYTSSNLISDQMLSDGRHFEYSYTFGTRMTISQSLFKDPSGLITYFDYRPNGYVQSLPARPPQ
jgi:YD repeat-containing protein